LFLGKKDIQKNDFTEALFEGRNKGYGAYKLRRLYETHIILSLIIVVSLLLLFFYGPYVLAYILPQSDDPIYVTTPVTEIPDIAAGQTMPDIPAEQPPSPPDNSVPSIDSTTPPKSAPKPPKKPQPESTTKGDSTQKNNSAKGPDTGKPGGGGADENGIYRHVDVDPSFPGGLEAMKKFFYSNFKMPDADRRNGTGGLVTISCVVMPDGTLTNIRIGASTASSAINAESLRVVKLFPPFNPGINAREPVKCALKIPFLITN
jgi:protein TonB